jgi:hypothetical protein
MNILKVKAKDNLFGLKVSLDEIVYSIKDNTFYHLRDISRKNKSDGWEQIAAIPKNVSKVNGSGTMIYPGAGIPNSNGSTWETSYMVTGTGEVIALQTSPIFKTNIFLYGAGLAGTIYEILGIYADNTNKVFFAAPRPGNVQSNEYDIKFGWQGGHIGMTLKGNTRELEVIGNINAGGEVTAYGVSTKLGFVGELLIVTDTYDILETDYTIVCNKATPFTVTLPVGINLGQMYFIKNVGVGTITLEGNGTDTIDGITNQSLAQWDCLTVQCYEANKWAIL